jgi:LmbE family N-acetylglucosaminyl deacetylase
MNIVNFKRILVLSPHTDDGELGAGGTISRFLIEGKEVHYFVFSLCESSIPEGLPKDILKKECFNSLKVLGILPERTHVKNYQVRTFPEHRQGILDNLIEFRNHKAPDLVLVPSSHDVHQDHAVIYWEALRAFKRDSSIWGYEHPWNNLTFTTDIFIGLDEEHVEAKIKALKQYKSQQDHVYMDDKNIRSLMITRGAQINNKPYAEAFELIRLIY